MDVSEEKFVRRLKKGSGKYKGNMPFKCFKCGKIGHFSFKFPSSTKGRPLMMMKVIYSINTIKRLNTKRKACV